MIGGVDIVIAVPGAAPSAVMAAAVRYILDRWPAAVVQDGDTGRRLGSFAAMDFGRLREVFVHQDQGAFESWESLGASPSNANQMVHLLASPGRITIVVDTMEDRGTAALVDGLRQHLRFGMPWLAPLEAA